jgi:hypothetical protein
VDQRTFLIAVGAVVLLGAFKLYGPVATSRRQQHELTRLRIEQAALTTEQGRLKAYKQKLASDAGFEAAARRLGYVREGERRLVFVPQQEKASSPAPPAGK